MTLLDLKVSTKCTSMTSIGDNNALFEAWLGNLTLTLFVVTQTIPVTVHRVSVTCESGQRVLILVEYSTVFILTLICLLCGILCEYMYRRHDTDIFYPILP